MNTGSCFQINCEVYHSKRADVPCCTILQFESDSTRCMLIRSDFTPPVCISRLPSTLESAYGAFAAVEVRALTMFEAMSMYSWLDWLRIPVKL